jgi:CRISPR-associated endoribonuclease Cas6
MRLLTSIWCPSDTTPVPQHYNHLVQSAILAALPEAMAARWHTPGGARPYTFSRLFGARRQEPGGIRFCGPVTLYVAAAFPEIIDALVVAWLQTGMLRVGPAVLTLDRLWSTDIPLPPTTMEVETLAPVVIDRTVVTPDGRRKTYYYAPFETEFGPLCVCTLLWKWRALFGEDPETDPPVRLTPVVVRPHRPVIVLYKGTVVKGWLGRFRLTGPPALLRLALACGLGARAAQGFGMVREVPAA